MPRPVLPHEAGHSWDLPDQVDGLEHLDWAVDTNLNDGYSADHSPIFHTDGRQLYSDALSATDYQHVASFARAGDSTRDYGNVSHHSGIWDQEREQEENGTNQSTFQEDTVAKKRRRAPLTSLSPKRSRTAPHDFEILIPSPPARGLPELSNTSQQQLRGSEAETSSSVSPLQHAAARSFRHPHTRTAGSNINTNPRRLNSSSTAARNHEWPTYQIASPPDPPPPQKRREYHKHKASARQMFSSSNTFQPNDEEEVRRLHLGHMSNRAESVGSSPSLQSRGAHDYTKLDNGGDESRSGNLRAGADMGHGPIPGVVISAEHDDQHDDVTNGSLPSGRGFLIQVGTETFKLSGASIMSDAPSYFSNFFSEQLKQNELENGTIRTLFIDRDPETFRDICRHLQGYVIQPRDAGHFARLFADAQLFSLPRLVSLLLDSTTFISIGGENFSLPRDIFSGIENTPNYFSLGFAVFFSSPDDPFPGLDAHRLLRPPPVKPPSVPGRSAKVFADILHLLRGYPLTIRDENHRSELLRDCRYFNLKGLEQRIILHNISYNASRGNSEIVIRLEDIRQSGISFVEEVTPSSSSPLSGWVHYARPLVDDTSHELIVEIDDEAARIDFRSMRIDFYHQTKARIAKLFEVIANKMNLPVTAPLGLMMATGGVAAQEISPGNTPLSEDRVKIRLGQDAHIILDGEDYVSDAGSAELRAQHNDELDSTPMPMIDRNPLLSAPTSATTTSAPFIWPTTTTTTNLAPSYRPRTSSPDSAAPPPSRKRRRRGSLDEFGEWMVKKGQWRLRVRPRSDAPRSVDFDTNNGNGNGNGNGGINDKMEIVMCAVKIEAFSGQKGRNTLRGFLR